MVEGVGGVALNAVWTEFADASHGTAHVDHGSRRVASEVAERLAPCPLRLDRCRPSVAAERAVGQGVVVGLEDFGSHEVISLGRDGH